MPAGRPTDYTPELLEAAKAYANGGWEAEGDKIPSIAGLACVIGVRRETCHVWATEPGKEEFSNILAKISESQERTLLNNGLDGKFNAPITKMILTKHGYSDKTESSVTHGGSLDVTTKEQKDAAVAAAGRADS